MSYAFVVRGATKEEAREKIVARFEQVEIAQPCHGRDRDIVQGTAFAYLDLLPDDPTRDVRVSCNGHMLGPWVPGNRVTTIHAANVCVFAELIERE